MIKNIFDFENNEKFPNKGQYYINKESKKNFSKSKEKLTQYPQVINNYDVNVRVNIKKLNENKINIENMNINELISKKINKREKKDFFNKTDNNINYINFNKYNNYIDNNNIDNLNNISNIKHKNDNEQNGDHYNHIISNLKDEFKEITKKHEINIDNMFTQDKKKENIRISLFNENNSKINERKELNINNIKNNILKNKENSWNLKSINNKNKVNNLDNNAQKIIKEKEDIKTNKMKTQNNFYKIPHKYMKLNENNLKELRLTEKNEEKLRLKNDKKNLNLKKAITFMNDNKKQINLNLTDNNLNINTISDDNSIIKTKEKENKIGLNLTFNTNNYVNKGNSSNNIIKDNNNIMKEYISHSKNNKIINRSNSFINDKNNNPFSKTQSFVKNENNKSVYKIIKIRNNQLNANNQNNTTSNINKQPKLLYLDKRINKIRKKMINKIKKESDINNSNKEINEIKIENNISFTIININNKNELSEKSLKIISKIINAQNNIIFELKQKEFILKNEIIKKSKEFSNLKNLCLKLMWFIQTDNLYMENNKKKNIIYNQILKENKILRKLYLNNKPNEIIKNQFDINNKMKEMMNGINEDGIFNNVIIKLKEKNRYNSEFENNKERLVTLENNGRFNREREYFNDKKRNKSYERIQEKNKKEENLENNSIGIIKTAENNFYKGYNMIKKNINFPENSNGNLIIGKKIKYINKEKNS